ncbi:MAG: hypothetical protein V2I43_12695, partial [Parvularcula sp.]|nr:hypothetical protein [Parvularcula sp.]
MNVLTRDQWLERSQRKGGIGKVFTGKHGLYVRVNPVERASNGGDKAVTAFRHCLVEGDTIPKPEQERILRESGLPIAAMIDSGGKSIHAWVRVEASDFKQYHERRERIWESLPESFEIDTANKNPSRYSRCPGARREDAAQRLIAVNLGPESFEAWEAEADGSLLKPRALLDLLLPEKDDPNTLLGNRWLCRGGYGLLAAPTGIGKSTFLVQ